MASHAAFWTRKSAAIISNETIRLIQFIKYRMNQVRRLGLLAFLAACSSTSVVKAGSSSSELARFYQNGSYDWINSATNIAMKVEGCVWSTSDDNEDLGCMEDESQDGTTYWYQMAMCRRAQVAYSVYASTSGSSSCSNGNFVGTVSHRSAWCWNKIKFIHFL